MSTFPSGPPSLFPSTYGALLIGVAFAIFFQGTLTVQAFIYYDTFRSDRIRLKVLVAVVYILDLVHLLLIFRAIYNILKTNWGSSSGLEGYPALIIQHVLLTAVPRIAVQGFFLSRIWSFSGKNVRVMIALLVVVVVPVGVELYAGINCLRRGVMGPRLHHNPKAGSMFVTIAFTDMTLALVMCHYLRARRSGTGNWSFSRSTNDLVNRCIHIIFGTGLATALIAVGASIAFYARLDALYYIAIDFQLARTYTNALLASLNSRESFRREIEESHPSRPMQFADVTDTANMTSRPIQSILCTHDLPDGASSVDALSSQSEGHDRSKELDQKRFSETEKVLPV